MKNILLPTDFSENSKHAIRYAFKLLKNDKCNFLLVNSYETPHAGAGMLVSIVDVLREESEKDMKEFHATLEKEGLTEGMNYRLISDHGSLVDVVERIHKRNRVDLVVMGTKGAGGLREVLIGSNTADIIKSGICSVLAIPEHASLEEPKKIVLASDNIGFKSNQTFKSLNYIAQKFNSEIIVLNVNDTPTEIFPSDELKQNFTTLLSGTKYSFQVEESEDVAEGINEYVFSKNIDLLAMVSRKIGFIDKLFHTSMTKKMAMHTAVPLLTMCE